MAEEEIDPAEAMREAIRQAAQEVTAAPTTVNNVKAALALLQNLPRSTFKFYELSAGNGEVVLGTNISTAEAYIHLTIRADGVFLHIADETAVSPEAELGVEHSRVSPALLRELLARPESHEFLRRNATTKPVPIRMETATALKEIGRRAVLDYQVSAAAIDNAKAANAAEAAVLGGIQQGLDEIELTKMLGGELVEGLEYLAARSDGYLRVSTNRPPGSSDIVLTCAAPNNEKFDTVSFRIREDGTVTFLKNPQKNVRIMSYMIVSGGDASGYSENFAEYDALNEENITRILTSAARSAALCRLIPPLTGAETAVGAGQQLVLDTLRHTAQAATLAHTAADEILHALAFLKTQLGDFDYHEKKVYDSSNVVIVVPYKSAPLEITVDPDGKITMNDNTAKKYDAFEKTEMDQVLKRLAQRALRQHGQVPAGLKAKTAGM